MTGTLRLTRNGRMGFELRRGPIQVYLDDASIGVIEVHGTIETELAPGRHTLRLRAGRYSSPPRTFNLSDDSAVTFRCHGAMLWPRYVASLAKPDLGIALRPAP